MSFLQLFSSSNIFPLDDKLLVGATVSMVATILGAAVVLTYFKKWKWLWKEWLTSLDPKRIGVMYIIVAVAMLLRGAADALMMRVQQATSVGDSSGIISSDTFQQVFTAHGTIMIFFVAMGLMFGLINLIVPLQIGARDVAFPFLVVCCGSGADKYFACDWRRVCSYRLAGIPTAFGTGLQSWTGR
jgi:hypothetical protein